MADPNDPSLIDKVTGFIGRNLYDPNREDPNSPHFDFDGQAAKTGVPSQYIVNGQFKRLSAPEAAATLGTQTYSGPNADEARDFETKARIGAGLKPTDKLPPIYDFMTKARAAGYTWDEINDKVLNVRQQASENGYSNDEINHKFLGTSPAETPSRDMPVPGYYGTTNSPLPLPADMPAEQTTALRNWSAKWFGPHDPFKASGYDVGTPGEVNEHTILGQVGWSLWDFAKTFPAAVVNGLAATGELANSSGKDLNPYEYASLAWEAAQFWALCVPGEAGKPTTIPPVRDFIDGAQVLSKHGIDPVVGMPALGDHFAATGEHPLEAVNRINSPEDFKRVLMSTTANRLPDASGVEIVPGSLGRYVNSLASVEDIARQDNGELFSKWDGIQNQIQEKQAAIDRGRELGDLRPNANRPDLQAKYAEERKANELKLRDEIQKLNEQKYDLAPEITKANEAAKQKWMSAPIDFDTIRYLKQIDDGLVIKGKDGRVPTNEDVTASIKARQAEGEGAKPQDPAKAALADQAANEKVIPPGDENKPMPVKKQTFKEAMTDADGKIRLGPRTDIQPDMLFKHDPEIASGVVKDWLTMWTPGSLAPNAGEAISAHLAKNTVEAQRSLMSMQRFGRAVGNLSTAERYKYIDAIETGKLENYPAATPLGSLAAQLRKELDHWHQKITDAGGEVGYVEDYLPHMYDRPEIANAWLKKRGQMAGGKEFTKERVFGTYAEAREAGLQMASDNPIHIAAVALNQMSRYSAALDVVNDFRKSNIITELGNKDTVPDGYVPIQGKLGVTHQGLLYAPENVATLLNNLVNKGLAQFPLYRLLRGLANTQVQLQLGFSGFHAMFVMRDVMTSQIAEGVKGVSRALLNKPSLETIAEVPRGLLTMAASPLAPFRAYKAGRDVIQHALGLREGTGNVPIITDAYLEGGGRLGMTEEYHGTAYGNFLQAFKGTFMPSTGYATVGQEMGDMWRNAHNMRAFGKELPGSSVAKFAFQLTARYIETAAAPIMAHLVPTMKAGVFSMAMREALRVAPEMGPLELRHTANVLNKSIDNRLGEMVYDNRFWNRTLKDILHLTVRAVGWNAGDIAEIPGGILDLATGKLESLDKTRQITSRTSYVVAVVAQAALTGAAIGYMTGDPPEDLVDYIFPKTPWGRISLPGYEKDIYNWAHKPVDTALGKLNPLINNVRSMMVNRDWYGASIADYQHEDAITNIKDLATWFGSQYMPISFRQQMAPSPEQREIPPAMRWLGVNPAPYDVRNPGAAKAFEERDNSMANRKRAKERAKENANGQ